MIFEVLTVVKKSVLVFWVVMWCGLQVNTNFLEEHTTSILRVED
jgi:hypothetical protein